MQRRQLVIDCLHRIVLHVHIDGGGNAQATGGYLVFRNSYVLKLADDLVFNVAIRTRGFRVCRVLSGIAGFREDHSIALFLAEIAHVHEAVKHVVPAAFGTLLVHAGVQARRGLNEAGEHGAFLWGEILSVLIKVGVGCRLDAVGIAAEVDRIQVGVEDVLFFPLVGHLDGVDELARLAHVGVFVAHQGVFHVLLGNRGTTTGGVIAGDLTQHRAAQTGEGKAGVIPEVAVLGGEHGVLHEDGDLIQGHVRAVAFRRHQTRQLGVVI